MSAELPKQYDPSAAQERWYRFWEEKGYFHSQPNPARKPFSMVIPPPNVTGALHMGHALNNTLQDIVIRWRRMQGFETLWVPGTDHAGIATQAVVERRVREEENLTRHDLGRDTLVARIWAWKEQYADRILGQLRELGCSCDWQRTRFTLDPGCARAVRQMFFNLFRNGLVYRGKRLVNWDTALQTAVADDEIFHEEVTGSFWTFRYPIKGTKEFIRFSTTRPETMLGDTAVAVHPDDPRYKHLIGKTAVVPLIQREIPIIGDAILVDPALGTGAVKVTPAHDPNDYATGLRHGLPMINVMESDGRINSQGGPYAGLDRYVARERITTEMERLGLFEGKEERTIDLAHSERTKTPIEPFLSDQWFVRMSDLAQSAIDAVNDGRIRFAPARYAKTYTDWLGEKRDWCISRQLWWGHRIPVWYVTGSEQEVKEALAGRTDVVWRRAEQGNQWLICSMEDLAARLGALQFEQDPDVLDTWFSSALWPQSTLGWPEKSADLQYYYPTNLLCTSRDIITLWVARMVIAGLYNLHNVPFHQVYVHPKILDGFGETMSKSKGNGIDPLDIISRYGADALRFGMAHLATETQDSRMPVANECPHCGALLPVKREHMYMQTRRVTCPTCKKPFRPGAPWPAPDPDLATAMQVSERFELGRNFANKLWNAARFALLNLQDFKPQALGCIQLAVEDRWILSRLARTARTITADFESFHFSDAARNLYEFIWSEFCDWYVEMAKARLRDPQPRAAAQSVLATVLDASLRLVHPIMPFVAEALWQELGKVAPERGLPDPVPAAESIVIAPWPTLPQEWEDAAIERQIGQLQELVRAIREIRNQYMIDGKTPLDVRVRASAESAAYLSQLSSMIEQLAGTGALSCGPDVAKPPRSATRVHMDFQVFVSLEGIIDVAAESKRLQKQLAEKKKHLEGIQRKLANKEFLAKAPQELVQQQRRQAEEVEHQLQALESTLRELQSA